MIGIYLTRIKMNKQGINLHLDRRCLKAKFNPRFLKIWMHRIVSNQQIVKNGKMYKMRKKILNL